MAFFSSWEVFIYESPVVHWNKLDSKCNEQLFQEDRELFAGRNSKFEQLCYVRIMENLDKLLFGDGKGTTFLLTQKLNDSNLRRS